MVLEVLPSAVDVVDNERATGASFGPARLIHEVINDQLAAAVKQAGKADRSLGALEHVFGIDFDPRQFAAGGANGIAGFGEFFLLLEERISGLDPLGLVYDFMLCRGFGCHFVFSFQSVFGAASGLGLFRS